MQPSNSAPLNDAYSTSPVSLVPTESAPSQPTFMRRLLWAAILRHSRGRPSLIVLPWHCFWRWSWHWCSSSRWCAGCCWRWGWSTWRRQRRLSAARSSWKLPFNLCQGIGQALRCLSINAGLVSYCKDAFNLSTLRMLE